MARKNYTIDKVLRALNKKNDCLVSETDKIVFVLVGRGKKNDLGNKSWGKIDFLIHYCNFTLNKVEEFSKPKYYENKGRRN